MSNTILPLTTVDFSAAIAELTPYINSELYRISVGDWTNTGIAPMQTSTLPITSAALAEVNATLKSCVYIEIAGGFNSYTESQPDDAIIIPLETTGSTINTYTVIEGAEKDPSKFESYFAEDCTLIESLSADEPVIVSNNKVVSIQAPAGTTFKAIFVFVNENLL